MAVYHVIENVVVTLIVAASFLRLVAQFSPRTFRTLTPWRRRIATPVAMPATNGCGSGCSSCSGCGVARFTASSGRKTL